MTVSLKVQNIAPLSMLIAMQFLAVILLSREEFDVGLFDALQESGSLMLGIGVVAGWLSYLIPADLKNALVFLRWKYVLPGHRFILLAEKDPRIDVAVFRTRVAAYDSLKLDQSAQNSYWYREFYKPQENQHAVASAHKSYLLYRDAASVSVLIGIIFSIAKILPDPVLPNIGFHFVWLFVSAAVGFIVAAANSGRRMVATAVAVSMSDDR
jgi:hypothetical protein